jgi:hypothetical protein
VLLNMLYGFSREHLGIRRINVGGEVPGWELPKVEQEGPLKVRLLLLAAAAGGCCCLAAAAGMLVDAAVPGGGCCCLPSNMPMVTVCCNSGR